MEIQNEEKFIRNVESLIRPMHVSNLLFFQKFRKILPPLIMKKLLYRASKKTPFIGFMIEPYSLFLFFKLNDIETAESMLNDRYELAKTKLFDDDEPEYYMGIGNLGTRASTFWGTRLEVYLIAKDKRTSLLSFIFIDVLSNTLISLPSTGIADPNCNNAFFTTSSNGNIYLEVEEKRTERALSLSGSIKNGKLRPLHQDLWLMGNTSIAYCKKMAHGDDSPFAVIFDPAEVKEALDIPIEDIKINKNTLFPGLSESELSRVICFPFAQHYIADSPGCSTSVKDRAGLVDKYKELSDSGISKTFSASTIVRQITVGIALSILITILLILLL